MLTGLISNHVALGNSDKAKAFYNELLDTTKSFLAFKNSPDNKHCLMFKEGDQDGEHGATKEKLEERIAFAEKELEKLKVD